MNKQEVKRRLKYPDLTEEQYRSIKKTASDNKVSFDDIYKSINRFKKMMRDQHI